MNSTIQYKMKIFHSDTLALGVKERWDGKYSDIIISNIYNEKYVVTTESINTSYLKNIKNQSHYQLQKNV
jgi:hypothetical protein